MNKLPVCRVWAVMIAGSLLAGSVIGETKRTFYDSGQLREEAPYADGVIHGVLKRYFENGQLSEESPMVAGRLNGSYKLYYETGALREEAPHTDGARHGLTRRYYPGGQVSEELPFRNGTIEGVLKRYHENGKPSGGYIIAIDVVDAGVGETVLVVDEGNASRQILNDPSGPVRSVIIGIVDEIQTY